LSISNLNTRVHGKTLQIDVFIAYIIDFVQCHTIWR